MSSTISQLTAAQLSQAAYTPLSAWTANPSGAAPLPAGWVAVPSLSRVDSTGTNQFIAFANESTGQLVFTFKGSDNLSNFVSDIANSGGSAWESIKPDFESALAAVPTSGYSGYTLITDGHSLGGGMAQTAAVESGLSCYDQNSLPISQTAISTDTFPTGSFSGALAQWKADGNTCVGTVVSGDPATLYYGSLGGQVYLNTSTTTLASPYAACEAAGAEEAFFGSGLLGAAVAGYCAYKAHSDSTVINLLQSDPASGDTAPVNSALSSEAGVIGKDFGAATINPTAGTATEGTATAGVVETSSTSASDTYSLSLNGVADTLSTNTAGSGKTFSTTSTSFEYDFAGGNTIDAAPLSLAGGAHDTIVEGVGYNQPVTVGGDNDLVDLLTGSKGKLGSNYANTVDISGADQTVDGFVVDANVESSNSSVTIEDTYAPYYIDTLINGDNYTGLSLTISGTAEYAAAGYQTVEGIGSASTVNMNLNYDTISASTGDTIHFGANTHGELLNGSSDVVTEGASADADIKGSNDTIDLSSKDKVDVSGTGDDVADSSSGNVIDVASNETVTISGTGETVVGDSGDTINVTGTSDHIFADSSKIEISGADTGDIVYGVDDSGDTGDWGGYVYDPGSYGGYGGGGYYDAARLVSKARVLAPSSGNEAARRARGVGIDALSPSYGPAEEALVAAAYAVPTRAVVSPTAAQPALEARPEAAARVAGSASTLQLIHAMSSWPHEGQGAAMTVDTLHAPLHWAAENFLAVQHLRARTASHVGT